MKNELESKKNSVPGNRWSPRLTVPEEPTFMRKFIDKPDNSSLP